MARKIDKLKGIASAMESEAADKKDIANKLNTGADILKKGIDVLEYWNPNDNSKRITETQQILNLEKKISSTYRKYILLWCMIIIITAIICIKFM